jgi:hypothetical protein
MLGRRLALLACRFAFPGRCRTVERRSLVSPALGLVVLRHSPELQEQRLGANDTTLRTDSRSHDRSETSCEPSATSSEPSAMSREECQPTSRRDRTSSVRISPTSLHFLPSIRRSSTLSARFEATSHRFEAKPSRFATLCRTWRLAPRPSGFGAAEGSAERNPERSSGRRGVDRFRTERSKRWRTALGARLQTPGQA